MELIIMMIMNVKALFARFLLLFILWVVLSANKDVSITWGLFFSGTIALLSLIFIEGRPTQLKFFEIPRFMLFFMRKSFRGGLDVALRAYRLDSGLSPKLIQYSPQVKSYKILIMIAFVISLLPGTLSAWIEEDHLIVHVLDQEKDYQREIKRVEQRICELFGIGELK